jgi:hypothetical protein
MEWLRDPGERNGDQPSVSGEVHPCNIGQKHRGFQGSLRLGVLLEALCKHLYYWFSAAFWSSIGIGSKVFASYAVGLSWLIKPDEPSGPL